MSAKEKMMNAVAKIGMKSAVQTQKVYCRLWLYQPKVPQKLRTMEK